MLPQFSYLNCGRQMGDRRTRAPNNSATYTSDAGHGHSVKTGKEVAQQRCLNSLHRYHDYDILVRLAGRGPGVSWGSCLNSC